MIKGLTSRVKAGWNAIRRSVSNPWADLLLADSFGTERLMAPYQQSPWVQRAIKKVAGPIAAVSLQFTSDRRSGDKLVDDPELTAFWQEPAVGLNRTDFIEASVGWLKLRGEYFWLLPDTALGNAAGPVPWPELAGPGLNRLIVARPDRMRCVKSAGVMVGWEFTDGSGKRWPLLPQQVIHQKFWNPYDDYRGLAEMDAAWNAAEADWLAGKYNLNVMRNNGDQGPFIVAKSGIPDDKQRTQIIESLREKKQLSLRGIFKPMFLTGDISVEDPKVQAPDANFTNVRLQNRHEIFLAFGVPPSMADKMESYSVGSASDWYMLITETCIPTGEKLAQSIDQVNGRLLGVENLYAGFDWQDHPVMQTVRRERIDAATKLWDRGMPMQKVNDYLELGLPEFEGWDVGYLPFTIAPVGSAELSEPTTEPTTDPAYAEEAGPEKSGSGKLIERATEKSKWRAYMAQRLGTVKAFQSKFNKELMVARAEVLRKLHGSAPRTFGRAAAADFMFDLETFTNGLKVSFRKESARALQTAGEQLFEEIGKDDPWRVTPAKVHEFFQKRENRIEGIGEEVFAQVRDGLQEGIDEGESIDDLSKRVRSTFNDLSRERSKMIAMTETQAAYGVARQDAMASAGVTEKKWLTSGNDNVRATHQAANGQVVGIDEAFEVGGEQLIHPGDPSGSPGNVINCHCVAVPIA